MNTWNSLRILRVQVMMWLLLALAVPRLAEAGSSDSQKAVGPETQQKLARVQIPFIPNRGQSSKEVKFTAQTFAGTVSVTETGGLVYSLPKLEGEKPVQGVTLKEELMGGKVKEVIGESQAVTKVSYFNGNDRTKWQSNLPSYDRVSLGEVYEGIEVKLKAFGNNVEKLFNVKPGAEPKTIQMKLSGGKGIKVNGIGELEVETEQGTVRFSKPVAYQEQGGKREPVEAAYQLQGNEYGFKVGDYDRTKELVIDPILAATYVGGSVEDLISALAIENTGNVYVAGSTQSPDFPGIGPSSADSTIRSIEGFVAKLNSDLSSVLAVTFLGGSSFESYKPYSLAVDNNGSVYVAGTTESSDFPGVGSGSADSTFGRDAAGSDECFVTKLNSDLSSILASTFLGGKSGDSLYGLALDKTGTVYVAGSTNSVDFPGIGPGSADHTIEGGEAFVAKLNSDLSAILAATFLGGSGPTIEWASAVAVDSTGSVYVIGATESLGFPGVGPGSLDHTLSGIDGFVAKLNSDLTFILAATYLGGASGGETLALALESTGNVYVAGSASRHFPGVGPGSADSTFHPPLDGFVAKLNSDLSSVLAATYVGDKADALALDSNGGVYVLGTTIYANIPGIGPGSADNKFDGGEGFVLKLNSGLSSILAATFLGGSGSNEAHAVALDCTGNVYVAGGADSPDFPGIGPGSADSSFFHSTRGFVAELDANLSSGLKLINDKVNFVVQSTSLSTTPVSGGPAGVYTITARLTNKTQQNILEPIKAILKTLSNGNKLLSATEGNGGAGSKQAIDAGTDNILKPNESVTVQFRIGLANRNRFTFFVDIWGTVSGGGN